MELYLSLVAPITSHTQRKSMGMLTVVSECSGTLVDLIVVIHHIYGQTRWCSLMKHPSKTSIFNTGVWAGFVAALNLMYTCTIRQSRWLYAHRRSESCWESFFFISPAANHSTKNLPIANTCSRGSGHCFMTLFFKFFLSSISCLVVLILRHGV